MWLIYRLSVSGKRIRQVDSLPSCGLLFNQSGSPAMASTGASPPIHALVEALTWPVQPGVPQPNGWKSLCNLLLKDLPDFPLLEVQVGTKSSVTDELPATSDSCIITTIFLSSQPLLNSQLQFHSHCHCNNLPSLQLQLPLSF